MDREEAIKQLIVEGILPTTDNINILVGEVPEAKPSGKRAESNVSVIHNFEYTPQKIVVGDFIEYFRNRYSILKNLIFNRPQVSNAVSISQAKSNPPGKVTIIAMISDLSKMRNGSLRLVLEDMSGVMTAIISPKEKSNLEAIQMLTFDEVIGLTGTISKNTLFVDDIIWPDIPKKPAVHAEEEVYAVFTGDLHVGSKKYLDDDFQKFIGWLNSEVGTKKQKEIASKTKYVFFVGDLVDGVGVYPRQEKEQAITDIYKQYDAVAKLLSQIPKDKHIIIGPGNHDAVRLEEPQPKLSKIYAAPLYEIPNVTMVTNPAYVKIHNVNGQVGFDVLMYHGYSFDHFVDRIEGLRLAGGYERGDLIHKYLLQRRHLSPTHNYNLTLPIKSDPLIISKVPDIIVSGHIHKARIGNYKNTLSFSGSCWQATTKFQEKMGHKPDPGHVPLLNLKTRKSTMLKFK